jgi:SAM-dependent methyltransferase
VKFHKIYDRIFADKPYEREVSQSLGLLGKRSKKILEIGCGTGRHTEFLLKKGVQVTAVDMDPAMIHLAKKRNHFFLGQRLRVILGGVEKAPAELQDGALSLFHVVNYVQTEKDLFGFFKEISRRLKPGCRFVFDAWNGLAAILDPPKKESPWRSIDSGKDKISYRSKTTTDFWRMKADLSVAIRCRRKRPETYHYAHRIWLPAEICGFLEMCRMKCERICTWKNPSRQATTKDWKIVFVARKF